METIKFIFHKTPEKRPALAMLVPPKVQDVLEYSYMPLLEAIRRAPSKSIKAEAIDENKRYVIDSQVLGTSTLRHRVEGLQRSIQLILAVQHVAQRYEMLDPNVQLLPAVSAHMGSFPLAAKINWVGAAQASPGALRLNASHHMVDIHRDLLNPHGNDAQAARAVTVQVNPRLGVMLGVGHPPDEIHTHVYAPDQQVIRLEGHALSYEASLILITGAVALSETVELATE